MAPQLTLIILHPFLKCGPNLEIKNQFEIKDLRKFESCRYQNNEKIQGIMICAIQNRYTIWYVVALAHPSVLFTLSS